MFDDGVLNEDPRLAREEVDSHMAIMLSPNPPIYSASEHPLRYVFQSVWQRIAKVRSFILLTPSIPYSKELEALKCENV